MSVKIIRERTLLDLERSDGDHLRVMLTKARTDEGQDISWHALEYGPVVDGELRPKARVVIRSKELRSVLETLHAAYFGNPPPGAEIDLPLGPEKNDCPF